MKKLLFILLTVLLMLPAAIQAQSQTLTVADGTSTNNYIPIYGWWADDANTHSQVIYPENLLNDMTGRAIESMSFYLSTPPESIWTATFRVKLGTTTSTTFSSSFLQPSDLTTVYTGNMSIDANNVMMVTFDEPFIYRGDNLLLDFSIVVPGNYKEAYFYGVSETNASIYAYSTYAPATQNFIPKATFTYGLPPTCPPLVSVSVTNLTNESADITWVADDSQSNFDIYEAASATDIPDASTTPTQTVTGNVYSMTNLSSSTHYYIYVRANCGDGDVSNWKGVSFLTLQIPAEFPYTQDWEDADENAQWEYVNDTSGVNKWVVGTAANNTEEGTQSLYVSNDYGVSNAYTNTSTSTSWAYRDIDFGTYAEYVLSFDWKNQGESTSYDYLKVYVGNLVAVDAGSHSAPAGATLVGTYATKNTWQHVDATINSDHQGVQRLYLLWWNDGSVGTNPPAAIDNIEITGTNCVRPTDVVIDTTTLETLTFHFTPATEDDVAWEVMLLSGNDTIVNESLYETEHTFTDLQPGTNYTVMVRTDCDGEYSSWTEPVSEYTECGQESFPFSEDFTYGVSPCWSAYGYFYDGGFYLYDGALEVSIYDNDDSYGMIFTPEFDNDVALNTVSLSFRYKMSSDMGTNYLAVGTVSSPDAPESFTTIATYDYSVDIYDTWITVEDLPLTNAGTDHHYVAFKFFTNYYLDAYIDDIELMQQSDCVRPNNLITTGNTASTVSLAWTEMGEADTWNVAYGPAGFVIDDETSYETAYENSITIEDLTMGSAYDFYVRADCGGETSSWRGPISVTPGSFIFGTSGSDTIRGCGYTIYDNGGPAGDYANNTNFVLVIYPENEGEFVQLSGTYRLEGADHLTIYDGVGTTATSSLWTNPSSSDPGTIPAVHSTSGPLTVKFNSDGSVVYSGFVLNQTCITCIAPTPVAQTVGSTSATITWPLIGDQDAWQVAYGPVGFVPSEDEAEDVYENTFLIEGLSGNTTYNFFIRTNCGDEYSDWSNALSFTTLSDSPATTPYENAWTEADENSQWALVNGSQTNKWYIGQPTGETGNKLFISSNGTSEDYNVGSASVVWAYRDILFGEGGEFTLDIRWKCYGESTSWDYLKVFFGEPGSVEAGNTTAPENTIDLSNSYMNDSPSWQHLTTTLNASYANTTQRLYFLWRNDGSSGNAPGAVIDTISITVSDCGTPYNITAGNLESTSVDMTFTPALSTDDTWEYVFGSDITTPDPTMAITTTENVISIDTLTPNTSYTFFVRTVCGDEQYSSWSEAFTFNSNCVSIDTLPFTENFDSYPASVIPDCWRGMSTYFSSYSTYPSITSFGYSDPNSLYFYSTSATYNMAILPKFDDQIDLSAVQVSFMYSATYETDFLQVGVMTNPYDASTFVALGTVYPNQNDPEIWLEKVIPFADYDGEAHYIAFKNGTSGNYSYAYIDDIIVDLIPNCPKPISLAVNATSTTSVTLSWTEMGEADTWEIVYGEPGFIINEATPVPASTNPFEVTDLDPATIYEFYVRANCSSGDDSEWSLPITGVTECVSDTMPFSEDFNTTSNGNLPVCWDNSTHISEYYYWESNSSGYQSSRCAYYTGYYNYGASLMSPAVELTEDAMVSFMYKMAQANYGITKIYVSTDGGATKTAIETELEAAEDWTNVWYDLSAYTGETVNIIIESKGVSYNSYEVFVDNFQIVTLPTCFAPTNLIQTGGSTTTIDVAWTPYGEESSWNVQYSEAGADNWSSPNSVTDTFTTITGLTLNTNYEIRVQANCGDDDLSDWTSIIAATTPCDDACIYTINMNDSYGDGWNGASIRIVTSLGTQTATCTGSSSSQRVLVCPGDTMTLSWNMGSYDGECSFTVVDGEGTEVYTCTDAQMISGNFYTGTCGTTPPTPTCDVPTNLASNNVTYNSANVTWTAGGSESAWNLQWRAQGGNWTSVNNLTTASYGLSGLTAQTTYEVQVQAVCDTTSAWSASHTFTTPAAPVDPCAAPTNLHVDNITANAATVTWNAGGSENSWEVQYKAQSSGSWQQATVQATTYTMEGLTPETAYEVKVRAICSTDNMSDFVSTTFTTIGTGIDNVTLANSISLMPNPADNYVVLTVNGNINVNEAAVYNAFGQKVQEIQLTDNQARIDLTNMASGMYFVRVAGDNAMATKKFIKK